jgi:hypothetical protein
MTAKPNIINIYKKTKKSTPSVGIANFNSAKGGTNFRNFVWC